MTKPDAPLEVEIKLAWPPEKREISADKLFRLVSELEIVKVFCGEPETKQLVSRYFDTPALDLFNGKTALRIRDVGARHIQTVKSAASGQSFARREWESELAENTLDLSLVGDGSLSAWLADLQENAGLAEVFETRITRTQWLLSVDETVLELALDKGSVVSAGREEPISEIEVEVKRGSLRIAIAVALALTHQLGLVHENRSKAERGYALAGTPLPPQILDFDEAGRENDHADQPAAGAVPTAEKLTASIARCLPTLRYLTPLTLAEFRPEAGASLSKALNDISALLSGVDFSVDPSNLVREIAWLMSVMDQREGSEKSALADAAADPLGDASGDGVGRVDWSTQLESAISSPRYLMMILALELLVVRLTDDPYSTVPTEIVQFLPATSQTIG
ncbi:MAG: CYTH domain-containing protein [Pseudomonadota bacterium]